MRSAWVLAALTFALAVCGGMPRRADQTGELLSRGTGPQFRCQLSERLGTNPDSLRLTVAVSIPYDNLVFLRTESGFDAVFELATTVFGRNGGLVAERVRRLQVNVATFEETNSRVRNAMHAEEFLVPPGEYRVRVTLTSDKDTHQRSRWEGTIALQPSDPLLRLSDIYWVAEDSLMAELGVPNVVESFTTADAEAEARVQVYSAGPGELQIEWTVVGEKGDTLRSLTTILPPDTSIRTTAFTLKIAGLAAQRYVLKVDAEGNNRHESRVRHFFVRIPGIPLSIRDLDLAIRQLKYIATPEENSRLRGAAPPERERLFKEFWKRRDPTPGTELNELMEEYYRRVEYANEKFSTHRQGWETDRGRIYMLYGEPTDIERHPFELNTRPYEIWFYASISRRFIFVDYTGFGDYTLATPEWGY